MRILLAVDAPSSHLFPLPNGWADRGHTVDIVMDAPDGRFGHAREHAHPGMRLMTLSTGGSIVDAVSGRPTQEGRLADLEAEADAVVIGGYATRVAREILRLPRAAGNRRVMLAERPLPRPQGPRRWIRDAWARWALSRVDAVWSMSAAGDDAFTRLGKAPETRIPYPIRVPALVSDPEHEKVAKWASAGPHRLVVLGQLIERKRPIAAVGVIREMREDGLDVCGDIAGTGPLETAVRSAAQNLPITLHGHVSASIVDGILARSHLLLHPASHDGWGFAVVEAASRGIPIVATDGCDAATELAMRTDGVKVTDGNPIAMAEAAARLLESFQDDPRDRIASLVRAVDEVCGVDRVVERSLGCLTFGGGQGG